MPIQAVFTDVGRVLVCAEDAVFIDNVLENVQAAQALGMQGVQFKSAGQVMAEIKCRLGH